MHCVARRGFKGEPLSRCGRGGEAKLAKVVLVCYW